VRLPSWHSTTKPLWQQQRSIDSRSSEMHCCANFTSQLNLFAALGRARFWNRALPLALGLRTANYTLN
jgi:hypothetical protein